MIIWYQFENLLVAHFNPRVIGWYRDTKPVEEISLRLKTRCQREQRTILHGSSYRHSFLSVRRWSSVQCWICGHRLAGSPQNHGEWYLGYEVRLSHGLYRICQLGHVRHSRAEMISVRRAFCDNLGRTAKSGVLNTALTSDDFPAPDCEGSALTTHVINQNRIYALYRRAGSGIYHSLSLIPTWILCNVTLELRL